MCNYVINFSCKSKICKIYVKEETRKIIKDAIKELKGNYNNLHIKNIAVLLLDLSNLFFIDILKGINEELVKNGYDVFSFDSNEDINKEFQILD